VNIPLFQDTIPDMRDTLIVNKRRLPLLAGALLAILSGIAIAEETPRTEPEFTPPPVPAFMLRRQDKPITLEEMRRQAEEAEKRVQPKKTDAPLPEPKMTDPKN
jgi:hypothetical protein